MVGVEGVEGRGHRRAGFSKFLLKASMGRKAAREERG